VHQYYNGSSHDRLSNVFFVRHVLRRKSQASSMVAMITRGGWR